MGRVLLEDGGWGESLYWTGSSRALYNLKNIFYREPVSKKLIYIYKYLFYVLNN